MNHLLGIDSREFLLDDTSSQAFNEGNFCGNKIVHYGIMYYDLFNHFPTAAHLVCLFIYVFVYCYFKQYDEHFVTYLTVSFILFLH